MDKHNIDSMLDAGLREIDAETIDDSFHKLTQLINLSEKQKASHNIKQYMAAVNSQMAGYIFLQIPYAARLYRRLILVNFVQLSLQIIFISTLVCSIMNWFGVGYIYPIVAAVAWYVISAAIQTYLNLRLGSVLYYSDYLYRDEDKLLHFD